MLSDHQDGELRAVLASLEGTINTSDRPTLQQLLPSLERLRAVIWIRLFAGAPPASQVHREPLEDLRHLTPVQVGEFLGMKPAYVHELCRSRRIPAIKQGKYWMIPAGDLHEWLRKSRRVDARNTGPLPSSDQGDVAEPSSLEIAESFGWLSAQRGWHKPTSS